MSFLCGVTKLMADELSARMMLILYVLLVVTKIVHAQTVKFKNRHLIKLV